MPDLRRKNCQRCCKPSNEVGPISWSGKCRQCGLHAEREAIYQLAHHSGPVFQTWRVNLAASVGATLVSDSRND